MCHDSSRRDFLKVAGLSLLTPRVLSAGATNTAAWGGAAPATAAPEAARSIATAANAFIAALRPELRQSLQFSIDDPERKDWSNLPPVAYPRKGLRTGLLNDVELQSAHVLLQSILSSQGYLKAISVMLHDDVFNELFATAARGAGGAGGAWRVREVRHAAEWDEVAPGAACEGQADLLGRPGGARSPRRSGRGRGDWVPTGAASAHP